MLPPVRLPEFALGIITARMVQANAWPRIPRAVTLAPLPTLYLALPSLPTQYFHGTLCAIAFAPLIAGFALADLDGRHSHLAHPALTALGDASYALYILHLPLMLITRTLLGTSHIFAPWTGVLIAAATITAIQAVALLTHRYYERPLIRRWSRPSPPNRPTAPHLRGPSPRPQQDPSEP